MSTLTTPASPGSSLREDDARYDLLVVGAGIAGLTAALTAAADGRSVCLASKSPLAVSASYRAQGGVAAALGADDSAQLHVEDTVRTGRGLSRRSAAQVVAAEAPDRIDELVELGVVFDDGLSLEGGHSRRRIVHAGGAETGARISRVLIERVLEHPRIEVLVGEQVRALRLVGDCCVGIATERRTVAARATLLATGGYAALWERTTNPLGSVGDGVVLAYGAGAAVADLELVQFHPTTLAATGFLLSEALRGEGALLLDRAGERFVEELAPRDVVARAIDAHGTALLDLRPVARDRFPSLVASLEGEGFDPAREPIPIAPAAHYTMGGIVTDLDARTGIGGLYAAGECACTGLHGANRLASNSLLECLVFGRRAALEASAEPGLPPRLPQPVALPPAEPVTPALRSALWRDAGLVRDGAGLEQLLRSPNLLVRLLAESALVRRESRGAHFRADFPAEDAAFAAHVVLRPGAEPVLERWS